MRDLAVDDLLHLVDVRVEDEPVEETADIPDFGRAFERHGVGFEFLDPLILLVIVALAVETFFKCLGDLHVDIPDRSFADIGLVAHVVRRREGELIPGLGRVVAHVDIDLGDRVAGADPALGSLAVGVFGILGVFRHLRGGRVVVALAVNLQAAVQFAEVIHIGTLAFERVADRVADLHGHDERAFGTERITFLPLISARALDAVADHRRRHVEPDFRAVAQRHLGGGDAQPVFVIPEIGIAERQRTAHGQPRPFHQS